MHRRKHDTASRTQDLQTRIPLTFKVPFSLEGSEKDVRDAECSDVSVSGIET